MSGFHLKARKPTTVLKPSEITVSKTFNDGNYESTRIELRVPMEKTDDVSKVFEMTLSTIHDLRSKQMGE